MFRLKIFAALHTFVFGYFRIIVLPPCSQMASPAIAGSGIRPWGGVAIAVVLFTGIVHSADPPAPGASTTIVHLVNGDFLTGEPVSCDTSGVVRWQAPVFTTPFDFNLQAVNVVCFPLPAVAPQPQGEYCFELTGGDVLFGRLAALDEKEAVIEVPRIGQLHIDRQRLYGIYRWREGKGLVYVGPRGLPEWAGTSPTNLWHEERGSLATDQPAAFLQGDFTLPPRVMIEFEVSWDKRPDFVLALGTDGSDASLRQAFRFEAWERDLVLLRETASEADVASIVDFGSGAGRAQLKVYLDQPAGRCLVFSARGEPLADLKVAASAESAKENPSQNAGREGGLSTLRLINKRGDIRLERLRIDHWLGQWDGTSEKGLPADEPRICLTDGTIVPGNVTAFTAAPGEFELTLDRKVSRFSAERVASALFGASGEAPERSAIAVLHDGSRIGGDLSHVAADGIGLAVAGVREPLQIPFASLRSVVANTRSKEPLPAGDSVIELDGLRSRGRLVDGREEPGVSCLVWQPFGSTTASPLKPGVSLKIIYREPPPARATPKPQSARPQDAAAVPVRDLRPRAVQAPNEAALRHLEELARREALQRGAQSNSSHTLHLRTGDTVTCIVGKIDEHGVSFRTPLSDSGFVPHGRVKAIELTSDGSLMGATAVAVEIAAAQLVQPRGAVRIVNGARVIQNTRPGETGPTLTEKKRDRLLTLPRMQRDNPPTHLIRSRNGDYLRGRLVSLDDEKLVVEVRLENREMPRDRVSRIIWLHADEIDGAPPTAEPAEPAEAAGTRVQAVHSDGSRSTFMAAEVAGPLLSGTSDVLGAFRVSLDKLDQLLVGSAIEQSAAKLAYQQWKLRNAVDPKFVQEDGEPDTGRESLLIGKPAPDFQLDLLSGERFRLSGQAGKVVVLDFWATWCGPCVQALPQVDKISREFAGRNVRVVAVNLEEAPAAIRSMLERHQLQLEVALDRDGAAAAKYQVTSIPQTLVIDAKGTIHRHYIGGGPHLGHDLKEVLEELLAAP